MSSLTIIETLTEDLSGQIDGSTTVVTTTNNVLNASEVRVLYNGQELLEGGPADYTITGATEITFTFTPEASSNIIVKITL